MFLILAHMLNLTFRNDGNRCFHQTDELEQKTNIVRQHIHVQSFVRYSLLKCKSIIKQPSFYDWIHSTQSVGLPLS